jgi:hypothetical protein
MKKLTLRDARKVLSVVDCGLSMGIGTPTPGQMCIEAAVCYALGLPHGDDPKCVASAVQWYKITVNDSEWSSKAARGRGMRRVAIAQLGSDQINERRFADIVARLTIQRILPVALRAVARRASDPRKSTLLAAAVRCETEGTEDVAIDYIRAISIPVAEAVYAARRAAERAVKENTASSAANYAADAAKLATFVRGVNADRVLTMAAEIAVEALQECGSQGCRWLWLCDE